MLKCLRRDARRDESELQDNRTMLSANGGGGGGGGHAEGGASFTVHARCDLML